MKKKRLQLRDRRLELGLSQAQVAVKMNMDQGGVARWEAGKHYPTPNTLRRLAQVLECEVEDLR